MEGEIIEAIKSGDFQFLKECLANGTLRTRHLDSHDVVDKKGRTLLDQARDAGNSKVLRLFYSRLTRASTPPSRLGTPASSADTFQQVGAPEVLPQLTFPGMPEVLPGGRPCWYTPLLDGENVDGTFGRLVQFTVHPALPQGLVLDEHTGILRGTPTKEVLQTRYSFTVKYLKADSTRRKDDNTWDNVGASEEARGSVTFAVVMPLRGLSYPQVEKVISTGDASKEAVAPPLPPVRSPNTPRAQRVPGLQPQSRPFKLAPTLEAGKANRFSVEPDLPAGMTMNKLTGEVHGVPAYGGPSRHESSHTVVAENALGMVSCRINLELCAGSLGLTLLKVGTQTTSASDAFWGCQSARHGGGTPRMLEGIPERPAGQVDWSNTMEKVSMIVSRFGSLVPVSVDKEKPVSSLMVKGMDITSLASCLGLGHDAQAPGLLLKAVSGAQALAVGSVPGGKDQVVYLQASGEGVAAQGSPTGAAALPPLQQPSGGLAPRGAKLAEADSFREEFFRRRRPGSRSARSARSCAPRFHALHQSEARTRDVGLS